MYLYLFDFIFLLSRLPLFQGAAGDFLIPLLAMQVLDKTKCDFSDKFTTGNINFFYEVPLNLFKRNIIIISYQDALAYFLNNRTNDFPVIFFVCKIYNLSLKCTQCASTIGLRTFISSLP